MLTIAGREATRDVQSATIVYISRSSQDLQAYSTHKLLKAIRDDDGSQRGLLAVGIWCIGEYGDLLLSPYTYTAPSSNGNLAEVADTQSTGPVTISFMALDSASIVGTVEDVTMRHSCPEDVKQRALTCFAKLSDRFSGIGDEETISKLQKLVQKNKAAVSLEMQLRSCEYDALLNAAKGISPPSASASDDIFGVTNGGGTVAPGVTSAAKEALARMPVVDLKVLQKKQAETDMLGEPGGVPASTPAAAPKAGGDLLDLEDIFGGGEPAPAPAPTVTQNGTAPKPADSKSDVDLLSDIFSAPPAAAPPSQPRGFDPFTGMAQPAAAQPAAPVNPMDLFGAPPPTAPTPMATPIAPAIGGMDIFGAPPPQQQQPAMPVVTPAPVQQPVAQGQGPVLVQAFSHSGLSVEFSCTKPDTWNKQKSTLVASFSNSTDAPIYGLTMQCAVPKYVTMEMQPPTSTTVPQSGGNAKVVTQTINVTNTMLGTKNLMLKLKVGFTTKGTKVEHMATCSGFPAGEY
eukprot:CAMPEP_0116550904 /NCGR_PEP_ID=MMETSP0397-20121206/5675_1 /TAXON_ID=216820 /ORGANISM="Cyclophora tenuis, Strain ECT3854" /LENGTH=514 /DNA_ID=CAMNT_0004075765 /DNA_START=265 /DNA_END=1809 /DNA_ORIENTATION=-